MSTQQQVRKKHHYNTQHALRRFADVDELLWMYRRGSADPVRVSVRDAASENFLYAPEDGPTPHDDSIEVWLADNIDGPAARILEKLIQHEALSSQERYNLSAYLVAQSLRTPKARDELLNHFGRRWKPVLLEMLADKERVREVMQGSEHTPPSDEQIAQWVAAIQDGEYQIEAMKAYWLDYFTTRIRQFAPIVMNLPMAVLTAPAEHEVLTSDSPLVGIWPAGWLAASEITLPLDVKRVLLVGGAAVAGGNRRPAWFRDINSRTIRNARRFVFSRTRQSFIPHVLSKPMAQREPGESETV
jgi:hypothetical protein